MTYKDVKEPKWLCPCSFKLASATDPQVGSAHMVSFLDELSSSRGSDGLVIADYTSRLEFVLANQT